MTENVIQPIETNSHGTEPTVITAPPQPIPLQVWRGFCRTAKRGKIADAARELGLRRSDVSGQVRELEAKLGTRLFLRDGPRLHLTPAGERLYAHALPLINRVDRLPDFLAGRWGETRAHAPKVRIALERTVPASLLCTWFERHPDEPLSVKTGDAREVREWLREYETDLVIGHENALTDAGLDFRPLVSHDFVLIAPADHEWAKRRWTRPRRSVAQPMVVPVRDAPARQWTERLARRLRLAPAVTVEVDEWDAMVRHVEAGVGIAFVPCTSLDDRVSVAKVHTVGHPDRYVCGMLRREGEDLPPATRRFVERMVP